MIRGRKASKATPAPVIQRAADGQWVTMGSHTVQALGGVDAANAAVAVVAHRVSGTARPESEIVKRIRANPDETLRLLSDIALFHAEIPDIRAFIEERLAELPQARGRGRPRVAEQLADFRRFDAVRKHLVGVYRAAGTKAPVRAADAKAAELLGVKYDPKTAARYRRLLRQSERRSGS